MTTDIVTRNMSDVDVYRESDQKLLLLIPKSRSKNYGVAIKIAVKLQSYQAAVDGQLFTICLVDLLSARDCELAKNVAELASNWKGFSIIYKGQTLSNFYAATTVLPCIKNAIQCNNPQANCLERIQETRFIKNHPYFGPKLVKFDIVVPCKQAAFAFYDHLIGIPINDQYQAYAVERGVNWCPFFDLNSLKKV